MYSSHPHFVLGFHGCDKSIADSVVSRQEPQLIASKNPWDWLGHGIYFWEQDPHRAFEWACYLRDNPNKMSKGKKPIKDPTVIGAVIDLGRCLNLLNGKSIQLIDGTYKHLKQLFDKAEIPLPQNTKDARFLDCAVINAFHMFATEFDEKPHDTVRGMFPEGKTLYKKAGFRKKNHIQLCVVNPNCIKGYFYPIQPLDGYSIP
ncbi:MAG: hypothetical protein PHD01_01995 [Geobacteraceae bacterium]|nr:hypothetical protein [Geobacteraceae bacterium]